MFYCSGYIYYQDSFVSKVTFATLVRLIIKVISVPWLLWLRARARRVSFYGYFVCFRQ